MATYKNYKSKNLAIVYDLNDFFSNFCFFCLSFKKINYIFVYFKISYLFLLILH